MSCTTMAPCQERPRESVFKAERNPQTGTAMMVLLSPISYSEVECLAVLRTFLTLICFLTNATR